jgi:hypothetical protein
MVILYSIPVLEYLLLVDQHSWILLVRSTQYNCRLLYTLYEYRQP